jgi:hypothetical protein
MPAMRIKRTTATVAPARRVGPLPRITRLAAAQGGATRVGQCGGSLIDPHASCLGSDGEEWRHSERAARRIRHLSVHAEAVAAIHDVHERDADTGRRSRMRPRSGAVGERAGLVAPRLRETVGHRHNAVARGQRQIALDDLTRRRRGSRALRRGEDRCRNCAARSRHSRCGSSNDRWRERRSGRHRRSTRGGQQHGEQTGQERRKRARSAHHARCVCTPTL